MIDRLRRLQGLLKTQKVSELVERGYFYHQPEKNKPIFIKIGNVNYVVAPYITDNEW